MKQYISYIPDYELDGFFTPIRSKIDYVKVILKAMKLFLITSNVENNTNSKLKIIIDKMSRLFIYNEKKYYSVSFPFAINTAENEILSFNTYSGKELGSRMISEINCIINNKDFQLNKSLLDFYIEPYDIGFESIYLLEELLLIEPSYVRYDFDPINENGRLHPLFHLDIHYSQYSTFKVGFTGEINSDYFEDIHNIKTDCIFFK